MASQGGIGTPVASGESVLITTLAAAEPWMPEFGAMLEKYDGNKDGRLSEAEFKGDADLGEHFGWLDANSDGSVERAEWAEAREMGVGEFGALAIRPDNATGQLLPDAVRWRFQKNLPFIPGPLVYQDVFYMVRDGGIITSLDPATGRLLKEGRSRDALGGYSASPVAADGKVYLASDDGKITVLKAGGQWEVLGVNDLGEEIARRPRSAAAASTSAPKARCIASGRRGRPPLTSVRTIQAASQFGTLSRDCRAPTGASSALAHMPAHTSFF